MSGLGTQALLDSLTSTVLASGRFDRVNGHEPKAPPGSGLSAAVWMQEIRPVPSSGLDATSVYFVANVRLYSNMLQEPQDAIDPGLCAATDDLMGLFTGHFTMGGLVRQVDLLGAHGQTLNALAGYITIQQTMFRVMTITLPLIINDVWDQEA